MKGSDFCWWHRNKDIPWWKNPTFIIGLIFTVSISLGIYKCQSINSAKKEEKSALSGRLESQETPLSDESIQVYFATNCYYYPVESLLNGKVIHPFSSVDVFLKGDQMLVSAKVFGLNKKIHAEMVKNEWKVNPNNYFDRNYDHSALEVRDSSEGCIVLQVEFLDQKSVRVAGLFEDKGHLCCVTDSGQMIPLKKDEIKKYKPILTSALRKQEFLFKYPSDYHLHERETNTKAAAIKDNLSKKTAELQARRSKYASLSNEELKKKTFALAGELTQLCRVPPKLLDSVLMPVDPNDPNSYVEESLKALEPLLKHNENAVAKFDEYFRTEAILLRDELILRIPQQTSEYRVHKYYKGGVNSLVIGLIAEDLKRLAKNL